MSITATQDLAEIYKPIRGDLERFREMIREELKSRDPFIQSLTDHLLSISGKNLRPALAIFCARLGGDKTDTPIRAAIAIELLHTATLVHDDIIDGATHRRSQPSMNAKWGIEVSIISGDYLYAKAFSILSALGDAEINRLFAACARTMCEGEMKQVETRARMGLSESDYTEIIHKKTASLFQAACAAGARLSGQPDSQIARLAEYGANLGLAFQITDDCLDIVGKEESLGKKAGSDFAKKDPTLPLIYLSRELNADVRTALERLLSAENGGPERFAEIQALVISSGALEACAAHARRYAAAAQESLQGIPDSVYRKSLADLAEYTVHRI